MTFINYFLRYTTISLMFILSHMNAQNTEPYKYPQSEIATIHSKVLNEDRKIYIHLPKLDSTNLDNRFPVLYLMDGENHFELFAQYADYLSRPDVLAIPKMIIVGIPNTQRRRDLTPTVSITDWEGKPDTSNLIKPSGGNEIFLKFIKTELIPAIDKSYKTKRYKILAGHSFGGLSSINCMLTYPDMFDAYIAVSPSFWWDDRYLLKLADKKLKKESNLKKILFYSDGNEGGSSSFFHSDLLKFDSLISNKNLIGLDYMYKHYPTETHMTAPIVAYFDALRFIFKEWEKQQ
ncbi:alpha/beta hydrolase [Aquimarina algiphila]|uniref:Alpha/beta hydrolase n=2 Tax=Aquimarina algiphila TaxID=2047982 RepID=A0A554VBR2_9FLAO|nr:alpha/beta hydrolase [Aquimarina algiphila]